MIDERKLFCKLYWIASILTAHLLKQTIHLPGCEVSYKSLSSVLEKVTPPIREQKIINERVLGKCIWHGVNLLATSQQIYLLSTVQ